MGRVWVAREQGFTQRPRLVAIKTALAEDAAAEEYWKVLLDEARIASQVQHPNVCAIHALDRERGVVYLVMDWSDGGSLRELLDGLPDRRLEPTVAARIVAHVSAGLHAAHELQAEDGSPLGVVHRDVSPQNVLLSSGGQIKITDFGVAKARGQLHAPTQTGEVKGKLSYMAPEQVTTRDVDRRADVFALGCVLYEASVGERPFHGGDALATLYQLLEQPLTPPSEKRTDYPPGLERIVLKALERDPEARYATTEEMGRALEMWLASERAMVGDSKIAEIVRTALGERISVRAQSVEAALAALDNPAPSAAPPVQGAETLSGAAASTLPEPAAERARPRRALWVGIAAGAAVLSLGVALAARGGDDETKRGPEVARAATSQVPPPAAKPEQPAPPTDVVVIFRAEPANATFYIDGIGPFGNPHRLSTALDARPHTVRATAPGYADREQEVIYDRAKEVMLVLPEAAKASLNTRKAVARPTAAPASAPITEPQPAAAAQRKLGELPPVTKKPPRSLDAENPFAKP